MSLAGRRGLLALVAVLLAQAVWILAVPPFRGSDEVDHVYRAAGVATGQLHLTEHAVDGRGLLVWVPSDIVQAAEAQCTSLSYTMPDNCRAAQVDGDRSRVATAAGAYDPAFYWIVGTVARPFHGAAADYAMRAATALLCGLLLAAGVMVMTWAGVGRWANLGVLTALTPEILYSGAIPAPDGPEVALGFLMWAALLAAIRQHGVAERERRFLKVAVCAAVPLTFLRLLGPLWVLLMVAAAVAVLGRQDLRAYVARNARVVWTGVVVIGLSAAWWAAWMLVSSHYTTPANATPETPEAHHWVLAFNLPAWLLQMVGAFPFRDQPAPLWVYPLVFFPIVMMVWASWRRSESARLRRVMFWLFVTTLVVPVALSIVFMPSLGNIWQGRYELPFVVGLLPLAGLLLDDARFAPVEGPKLVVIAGVCLVVAQVVCVVNVERMELLRPASANDSSWHDPGGVVLALMMLVACGVAALIPRAGPRALPPPPVVVEPTSAESTS